MHTLGPLIIQHKDAASDQTTIHWAYIELDDSQVMVSVRVNVNDNTQTLNTPPNIDQCTALNFTPNPIWVYDPSSEEQVFALVFGEPNIIDCTDRIVVLPNKQLHVLFTSKSFTEEHANRLLSKASDINFLLELFDHPVIATFLSNPWIKKRIVAMLTPENIAAINASNLSIILNVYRQELQDTLVNKLADDLLSRPHNYAIYSNSQMTYIPRALKAKMRQEVKSDPLKIEQKKAVFDVVSEQKLIELVKRISGIDGLKNLMFHCDEQRATECFKHYLETPDGLSTCLKDEGWKKLQLTAMQLEIFIYTFLKNNPHQSIDGLVNTKDGSLNRLFSGLNPRQFEVMLYFILQSDQPNCRDMRKPENLIKILQNILINDLDTYILPMSESSLSLLIRQFSESLQSAMVGHWSRINVFSENISFSTLNAKCNLGQSSDIEINRHNLLLALIKEPDFNSNNSKNIRSKLWIIDKYVAKMKLKSAGEVGLLMLEKLKSMETASQSIWKINQDKKEDFKNCIAEILDLPVAETGKEKEIFKSIKPNQSHLHELFDECQMELVHNNRLAQ